MTTPWNVTAMNYSNWGTTLTTANVATNGMLGFMIPFLFGIVVYAFVIPYGFWRAFTTATFIAFLVGLPLYAINITPAWGIMLLVIGTIIGFFFLSR